MKTERGKIGFIGGDRRMMECARIMAGKGFETAVCGFERYTGDFGDVIKTDLSGTVTRSVAVVLALPCCTHGMTLNMPFADTAIEAHRLFDMLPNGDIKVFCGKATPELLHLAHKKGIELIDYFESEKLQILNAIPTAEGAICCAMQESGITIHGSSCLVTGYGRIAKLLSEKLRNLGAKVTVLARSNEALTWAKAYGCDALHISEMSQVADNADFIFNTVPHRVICEDSICKIHSGAVMVELASSPGGIDLDAVRKHGIRVVHAGGLPGKNSPVSAGMYISEVLCDSLLVQD